MTVKRTSSAYGIAVAALIVLVAFLRVYQAIYHPQWQNFSPVMAMAFCGGLFLPGAIAWFFPFAVLALSDVALALALHYPVFGLGQAAAWLCFAVGVGTGRWLAAKPSFSPLALIGLVIGNSLLFYLVTNSVSWFFSADYAHNLSGLVQALTVGLPGYPPTWMFFRHSLASDLIFAGLILGVRALALRPAREVAAAAR